jgi:hypothetical protein
METLSLLLLMLCCVGLCSKPTVWDGDSTDYGWRLAALFGFKPTGWDGDLKITFKYFSGKLCSEPTVWDGDLFSARLIYSK